MTEQKPETYTKGLGELIRAHRFYVGISEYTMARLLGKDRRDYQRIENGRDACPPGMLTRVEALSKKFDDDVDKVVAATYDQGGVLDLIVDPGNEWDRLVAGRAAVEAPNGAIKLTLKV